MAGQIERQSSSYRQGLVLGLTMAEIMVLLVFCLLLGAGAALTAERSSKEAAVRALESAQRVVVESARFADLIKAEPRLVEALRSAEAAGKAAVDEFWRRLVESKDLVDSLEKRGVNSDTIKRGADLIARAAEMAREGTSVERLVEKAARSDELDRLLQRAGIQSRDVATVAGMAERGSLLQNPKGHQWPPIIKLSEAGGYFFDVGSAELKADFANQLRSSIAPQLLELTSEYGVDVIEVVGHTDEQPIGQRPSNLDKDLSAVLRGVTSIGALKPADNAGLGLARAVAVVSVLTQDARLRRFRLLPLSGAQLILTDETLSRGESVGDVKERRRIEIRLRKAS